MRNSRSSKEKSEFCAFLILLALFSDVISISVILCVSLYLSILTALFWQTNYKDWSYGLLLLSFLAAGFGNTSVMVFFSYASEKNLPFFKTSMTIGYCKDFDIDWFSDTFLAVSGLIALFLGLSQNVEHSNHLNFTLWQQRLFFNSFINLRESTEIISHCKNWF